MPGAKSARMRFTKRSWARAHHDLVVRVTNATSSPDPNRASLLTQVRHLHSLRGGNSTPDSDFALAFGMPPCLDVYRRLDVGEEPFQLTARLERGRHGTLSYCRRT